MEGGEIGGGEIWEGDEQGGMGWLSAIQSCFQFDKE